MAAALLLVGSGSACAVAANGSSQMPTPATALEALLEADRLEQHGRVYLQGAVRAEGRVISLGQQRFRVGAHRFEASHVDSLYIRHQSGMGGRSIIAGAGIGALGTMFLAVVAAYAGLPVVSGANDVTLLGGGALVGGLVGAMAARAGADETWHRRWPAK